MKKSCSYCGRIHDKDYSCPEKPKRSFNRYSKKKSISAADRFRRTGVWRRLSEQVRERDRYICQACLYGLGSRIKYSPSAVLEVHHIEPIEAAYEKRDEEENCLTLCQLHHKEAEDGTIPKAALKKIAKKNIEKELP